MSAYSRMNLDLPTEFSTTKLSKNPIAEEQVIRGTFLKPESLRVKTNLSNEVNHEIFNIIQVEDNICKGPHESNSMS
jgi:hypothetical protein